MTTELDQLAAMAAEVDAGALPPPVADPNAPAAEAAPAVPDFMTEARAAVDMFAALVVGYAPAAADVWGDPVKARVSAALAPVMEKYGFSFGAMPPELTLLIVAGPPLFQSSRLIAAQMAADRAKSAKAPAEDRSASATSGAGSAAAPLDHPELLVHPQVKLYQ